MKIRQVLIIVVAGLIVAASATAADVKPLYTKECAKCHGADGKGQTKMGQKVGVRDYTSAKVQDSMKDPEMAKAIKEGVKGSDGAVKMKAFDSLTDEEVKGLVTLIRSFKAK